MAESLVAPFNDDPTLPCRAPDANPEDWFAEGTGKVLAESRAVTACSKCHRRTECLLWALRTGQVQFGVLAGLTPRQRRKAKSRVVTQPEPPQMEPVPFGWTKGGSPNPDRTRRIVAAARRFVAGAGTKVRCAAEADVNAALVGEAGVVLRTDPDLLDAVEAGRLPLARAYEYAVALRRWAERASGESEAAA